MAADCVKMMVSIKMMSGEIMLVECDLKTSVQELKQKIADAIPEFPVSRQCLLLVTHDEHESGVELRNSCTLQQLGVNSDSLLCLFLSDESIPRECLQVDFNLPINNDGDLLPLRELIITEIAATENIGTGFEICSPFPEQTGIGLHWGISPHALPFDRVSTWAVVITSTNDSGMVRTGIVGGDRLRPSIGNINDWPLERQTYKEFERIVRDPIYEDDCKAPVTNGFYGFATTSFTSYLYKDLKYSWLHTNKLVHISGSPILMHFDPLQKNLFILNPDSKYASRLRKPTVEDISEMVSVTISEPAYVAVGVCRAHRVLLRPLTTAELSLIKEKLQARQQLIVEQQLRSTLPE